jgi:predicted RNase H-like nuclease (RuvC/YqgF family)
MWVLKHAQEAAKSAAVRLQETGSALLEQLDGSEEVGDEEYEEEDEEGAAEDTKQTSVSASPASISGDDSELRAQLHSLQQELKAGRQAENKKSEVALLRQKLEEVKAMRDGLKADVSATLKTLSSDMATEIGSVVQAISKASASSASPAPAPTPAPTGGALLARAERADAEAQALREQLSALQQALEASKSSVASADKTSSAKIAELEKASRMAVMWAKPVAH